MRRVVIDRELRSPEREPEVRDSVAAVREALDEPDMRDPRQVGDVPVGELPDVAHAIAIHEFVDARLDPIVPGRVVSRARARTNTGEAMEILGYTKNGLYSSGIPYELIDGHRVYDLDAVREYAAKNLLGKLLRVGPAAKMLGVKPVTLSRWTVRGEIPCVEVNGRRAYRVDDLATFAERLPSLRSKK